MLTLISFFWPSLYCVITVSDGSTNEQTKVVISSTNRLTVKSTVNIKDAMYDLILDRIIT